MTPGWNHLTFDKRNLTSIGRRFGRVALRSFPAISTLDFIWFEIVRRIRWISFLDYFDFVKSDAIEVLTRDFGFRPYPYKHYESVFTRFYQGFLLPHKFGIDKRRVHLATLVASGRMSREEALQDLAGIPYASEMELEQDKHYFIKKMGWASGQLEEYIARPRKPHTAYPSEKWLWDSCADVYRKLSELWAWPHRL